MAVPAVQGVTKTQFTPFGKIKIADTLTYKAKDQGYYPLVTDTLSFLVQSPHANHILPWPPLSLEKRFKSPPLPSLFSAMLIHHHLPIFVHKHVYWRWAIRPRYFNICRLVVQSSSFTFSSGGRSLRASVIVASPIPIAGGAKTGVGLQCGDSSCIGSFLLGEEGGVDFFAFTTRGEDLLDSDGGSAKVGFLCSKETHVKLS